MHHTVRPTWVWGRVFCLRLPCRRPQLLAGDKLVFSCKSLALMLSIADKLYMEVSAGRDDLDTIVGVAVPYNHISASRGTVSNHDGVRTVCTTGSRRKCMKLFFAGGVADFCLSYAGRRFVLEKQP